MKYSIVFIVGLLAFTLSSCSNNGPEEVETVSIEELMGEVEELAVDSSNFVSIDTISVEESNFNDLILSLTPTYDTVILTSSHIMDRYGYNSSKKIEFKGKEDVSYGKSTMVTPKAEFYEYNFSDSIKLNNAFYNWLDCYGSDCNEVKINQDIKSVKTPPSFILVYDTTLISVKYLCEHQKNDWKSFQDSILNKYGKDYRYRIDVGCGGPLEWK